ncbi:T9SS type A sorting domain-containing protein [Hymenobacter sp. B81]|uniref:T9SS type A sorting domain-containing protein n=1 Tax=Hymenobacter sp. B81 TaxID=3344878 RepID=UPI0037DC76B5
MKKTFCLLAALLLASIASQAQWLTLNTANSGLHSDVVREVAVADNGTLWVATQTAVQKYDGTSWTTYTQADGLDYTAIKCVAVRGTTVWVGHDRGLSRFDGTSWINFTNAADLPVGLFGGNDRTINDVVIQANGTIWLAGSRGLGRYNGTSWTKFNRANSGLNEEAVTALALDEALNTLWIGTNCLSLQSGVYSLNTLNLAWRYYSLPGGNCVHGLAVGNTGTVFVGTCNASGLTTIDAGTGTVGSVSVSGCVALDGVAADPTDPTRAWVVAEPMGPATSPRGLLAYSAQSGGSVTREFNVGNSALPSPWVTSVAVQPVGSALKVWVGTTDRGLAVYETVVTAPRPARAAVALQLLPNPATDAVEVRTDLSQYELSVYDNAGRLRHRQQVRGSQPLRLPVLGWARGLYHVRLRSEQGSGYARFSKS